MKRTDSAQLPSLKELEDILSKEAKRKVPHEKEDLHYVDFSSIVELLTSLNIDTTFFTDTYNINDLDDARLLYLATELVSQTISKIHEASPKLTNNVYDYLSEEDPLERADLIFVFGARTLLRIKKAVELWKDNYAPVILISGNQPNYTEYAESEANVLRKYAIDNSVDKQSIIIESEAITLPDNVKRTLNLIDNKNIKLEKIILVNSPFSQRRGWCHFQKFSNNDYKFIRINSEVSDSYNRDSWYKNEQGIRIILNEFIKMKMAVILNSA